MPITKLLERNAALYPNDIALVELNPDIQEKRRRTYSTKKPTAWRTFCFPAG